MRDKKNLSIKNYTKVSFIERFFTFYSNLILFIISNILSAMFFCTYMLFKRHLTRFNIINCCKNLQFSFFFLFGENRTLHEFLHTVFCIQPFTDSGIGFFFNCPFNLISDITHAVFAVSVKC